MNEANLNIEDKNEESVDGQSLNLKVAARLIIDAGDIRNVHFIHSEEALWLYELYLNKWINSAFNFVMIAHFLVLPLFEEPSFVQNVLYWLPCLAEFMCLFIYACRLIHSKTFQAKKTFFSDRKNILLIILIIITALDLIAYMIVKSLKIEFAHRYTRFLRILFYINFDSGKTLRRTLRNLRRALLDILNVYVLFVSSLLLFSFIGWQMFKEKNLKYPSGVEYFTKFDDALWDMYVAVTTANFPDVMMPAYRYSSFYALFFIMFMITNVYVFVNITLATIYTNYKKHLAKEVNKAIRLKKGKLEYAFHLLKTKVPSETESFGISLPTFTKLLSMIDSSKTELQINTLFKMLDVNNNQFVMLNEFLSLSDLLKLRICVSNKQVLLQKYFPGIYESKTSRYIRTIVSHSYFSIPFDILILVNIVVVALNYRHTEWCFLCIFIIEILLKLYTFGSRYFFSHYMTILDFVAVFSAVIIGIIELNITKRNYSEVLDLVLILRTIRITRVFARFKRFRKIVNILIYRIPSFSTYVYLIFSIYYAFGMIGMEIFGDKIKESDPDAPVLNCSNDALLGSDFANFTSSLNYCKNNFENFLNTIVLMFEFMVVNQWYVLADGFVKVTGEWAKAYFIAFHISCVVVSLNLFTAFVLELFFFEYDAKKKTLFEKKIEEKIAEIVQKSSQKENNSNLYKSNLAVSEQEKTEEETPGQENVIIKLRKKIETQISSNNEPKEQIVPIPNDLFLQKLFSKVFDSSDDESEAD